MSVVSDSEEVAVILDEATPPKKQTNARVHWFFTFNNYSAEDINILRNVFGEVCYMYAFQEEIGECGTPHLQGVISLKKRARWTEFGLPVAMHWEKPINVKDCYLYCTKEETRNGNVYVLKYQLPYVFKLGVFFSWQRDILDIVSKPADDRKVHWYWSESGRVGKSCFCKHLVMNNGACLLTKGTYGDMCNLVYKTDMMVCKIVIFDLPRNNGNKISYSAIESIKNGMICNTKYETGFKCFPSPHLIVFANEPPDFEQLSDDRWCIVKL